MKVGDFVQVVKRDTRYGQIAVTTDQATADILARINIWRKRIWSKYDWKWAREALAFAVSPGTTQYAVSTASGNLIDRIQSIIPYDQTVSPVVVKKPLKELTVEDFYAWLADHGTATPGAPDRYCNIGIDSNGKWNVIIWPSPASAFTMRGYGKKLLTTFVTADVVANASFDYFPDGIVEDVLLDGVMSGVYRIQGNDAEASRLSILSEDKLKMLVKEQAGVATDNTAQTSPPPPLYAFGKRNRGGTTVV